MQNDLNVLTLTGTVSVNHNIAGSINIGGGGGTGNEDAILSGTWTKSSYSNSTITKLSPGFPDNVNFENVTEIGAHACEYSVGGKNWNLPNCVTVGSYAFRSNETITSILLPKCTSLSNYAFDNCTSLTNVSLPLVQSVGQYTFTLTRLETINLPECITVAGSAFRNNGGLTSINLPKCQMLGTEAFIATALTTISLPSIVELSNRAFNSLSTLTSAELGENITTIGNNAFYGCTALMSLTVHATTPPTLGSAVFNNTPILSGEGKIYVPASAVDTYKAASGWSTYASHIEAIPSEESQS